MSEASVTRQRILEAAEDVLRRFGPSKANVVDVARALGVSHGNVYKHFSSKVELRDAVVRVWLERVNGPLEAIIAQNTPAKERLYRWLRQLISIKRSRAFDDPELFATYCTLAAEAREVVTEHMDDLARQLTQIVEDGVRSGEFTSKDAHTTGKVILVATTRFHNPAHAVEWSSPHIDQLFEAVWEVLLQGIESRQ